MKSLLLRMVCVAVCACLWAGCDDDDDKDSAGTVSAEATPAPGGGADAGDAAGDDAAADAEAEDGGEAAEDPNVAGRWTGTRSNGGGSTTVTINFTQKDIDHMWKLGGTYSDTSGFHGIITGGLSKGTRTVSFAAILMDDEDEPTGNSFSFVGEVGADGNTITGTYEGGSNGDWSVSR